MTDSEVANDVALVVADVPAKKIKLQDMIVFLQGDVLDLEVWETVYKRGGEVLPCKMKMRLDVMRKTVATLDLVMLHEQEFLRVLRDRKRK